jgi:hypothetical protein
MKRREFLELLALSAASAAIASCPTADSTGQTHHKEDPVNRCLASRHRPRDMDHLQCWKQ